MYQGEVDALKPHETEAVLDAASELTHRKELTIRVILETGLRAGELAHIKKPWLRTDLRTPAIAVPDHEPCSCNRCTKRATRNLERWCTAELEDKEEMERRPDVGSERYEELLEARLDDMWKPKSETGSREVPVHDDWVWENIVEHVEEQDGWSCSRVGIWYRVEAVNEEPEVRELDLPTPVAPHVLRHTYGTELARGSIELDRLQALMGHASIESTQQYLHPTFADLSNAVEQARENA